MNHREALKKYTANVILTISLRNVPAKNHKKAPKADFSGCALPCSRSPIRAPKNGHPMIHNNPNGPNVIHNIGRSITHIRSQIVAHVVPRLVHHIFFVHTTGII